MSEIDWRARLIEVFVECLHDADFGQSGDDAIDIIHHIKKLRSERDVARAEAERLRAACSRKEDVYPTETVITRSASDLLVEFSQFAFFLGDIRKSKEASYRAQYIRAALESEADHE